MQFRCPKCQQSIRIEDSIIPDATADTLEMIECPVCHSQINLSSPERSAVSLPPGSKIEHFLIQAVLGEGSFGTVYKAWDSELQRYVALKVPRESRVSAETAKLFLREARSAAGISHPNVVAVFELGQFGDSFYIATEFIDGTTLSEHLQNHPFEPNEATALVIKLLRGVQVFHDKGIIHRDLKPGNIILDVQHEPHILDFGLARSDDFTDLTATSIERLVGTPHYMSPEQARGDGRAVSHRSDIYAIGVILYELLTGQRPFKAASSTTLFNSILTDEPVSPRILRKSVSRDLETICLKAMRKDPAERFDSASEMADDLQRILDQKSIVSRPVSFAEKSWRLIWRHRLASGLMAVLIPLSVVVIFLLVQQSNPGMAVYEAPPASHLVHLTWKPAGLTVPQSTLADWTIVPLDRRTREPVPAEAIRISQSATADIQVKAGEYLVIVNVPDFGFHEVYRTVPNNLSESFRGAYAHLNWEVKEDGQLMLPPVAIRATSEVVDGMVSVPAGRFEMGDGNADRPLHSREIADFFVDGHEVSVDEYQKLMPLEADYSFPRGSYPVAVDWDKAIDYAELMGKRLLKEDEFEYLAHDLGHSLYPSGNEPLVPPGDRWPYPVAGQPEADRMTSLPVFGMHSNVAEWTDSLLNSYPGIRDRGPEIEFRINKEFSRVVRGGPVSPGRNDRELNTWDQSTSHRAAWNVTTVDSEIGFRCARSAAPRFQK